MYLLFMKYCGILKSFRSCVYLISFCLVLALWKNSLLCVLSGSRGCTVQGPCQGQMALGGQVVPWELRDVTTTGVMAVRVRDRRRDVSCKPPDSVRASLTSAGVLGTLLPAC